MSVANCWTNKVLSKKQQNIINIVIHIKKKVISKPCEICGCGTQSKLNVCRKSGCGYDKRKRTRKKMGKIVITFMLVKLY